jgi:hypothetical protein
MKEVTTQNIQKLFTVVGMSKIFRFTYTSKNIVGSQGE